MIKLNSRHLTPLAVIGLGLGVAAWISFAQLNLFPSVLNKCAIAHPWLLHNGFVDYQHLPGQKSPLLPLLLSWLLPLFGGDAALGARTAHAAAICSIVLTTMLWAYRSSGRWALLATGLFLLTWSNFFGLWAIMYYDVALAPLFLLFFILAAEQMARPARWRLGLLGLITGCAILTKQYALLLGLPIAVLLAWRLFKCQVTARQVIGQGLIYLAGLILPLAVYAGFYYRQAGSFQDLIYWTVTINLAGSYASEAAVAPQPDHIRDMLPALLMLVPFAGSILFPQDGMKPARGVRLLLLALFFLGVILLYPRYTARHWPVAFPFLALMSGIACADLARGWRKLKAPGLALIGAAVLLCWVAIGLLIYLPRLQDPTPPSSTEYSDLIPLAAELQGRIPADGAVALLPLDEGNANLSYLLGRLPPRYWLFNYRWFLTPAAVDRWLDTMEEEQPETLLFFPDGIDLTQSAPRILDYVGQHYQVVDTVKWGNRRRVDIMLRLPTQ